MSRALVVLLVFVAVFSLTFLATDLPQEQRGTSFVFALAWSLILSLVIWDDL
ncbi:hypothetical protein ACT80S_18330 [Ramlibacter sp. MAHUQ-53]|uniref:hypothetical protein n=1 Tax=unclassified Ramlibacter TaxID=2617605 RepID=UPI003628FF5A